MATYTHEFVLVIDDVTHSYDVTICPHLHIKTSADTELTHKQHDLVLQILELIMRLDNCSDSVSRIRFIEK